VLGLGVRPILSPARLRAGKKAGRRRPEPSRAIRVHLTEQETKTFDRLVRERARLAESSVMALCCARVLDGFFVANGQAPPRYAVPIPLSLDPKAGTSRLFGNNLSMMMFAIDREDLTDGARAIGRLAEQQRAIVRGKLDVGMMAALDFASYLPAVAYSWLATRPFAGELASFIFSNPGALTIERFAGLDVIDAYPLPAVVSPPGAQFTFTRFRGRLSAFVGYVESALSRVEAGHLAEALHRELLAFA